MAQAAPIHQVAARPGSGIEAELRWCDAFGGLRYDGRTGAGGNQRQHGLQVGGLLKNGGVATEFGVQAVDLSGQAGPSCRGEPDERPAVEPLPDVSRNFDSRGDCEGQPIAP